MAEKITLLEMDFNMDEAIQDGKTSYIDHQKPELLTSAVILLLSFNLYYVKSCILIIY